MGSDARPFHVFVVVAGVGRRTKARKARFVMRLHCSDAVTWISYCSLSGKRPRDDTENPAQLAHPREVQKAMTQKGSMYVGAQKCDAFLCERKATEKVGQHHNNGRTQLPCWYR